MAGEQQTFFYGSSTVYDQGGRFARRTPRRQRKPGVNTGVSDERPVGDRRARTGAAPALPAAIEHRGVESE